MTPLFSKLSLFAGSLVSFRNAQSRQARGSLVRLSRRQAVFEVYDPASIGQLTEVLSDVCIVRGEGATYRGRAVVTSRVNTGLMLIVSASLVDPWSDFVGETGEERLHQPFQIAVDHLREYFDELHRRLKPLEPPADAEFVREIDRESAPRMSELVKRFEVAAKSIPGRLVPQHRVYAQRELHPRLKAAPFLNRAIEKPLRCAGDYESVRMALADPRQGPDTFAKVLNAAALRLSVPAAQRDRVDLLTKAIRTEARRVAGAGRRLRVLNLGCGPAAEVRRFCDEDSLADRCDFTLIDFHAETLDYLRQDLLPHVRRARSQMNLALEQRSLPELLRGSLADDKYDLIYCSNVFDYLDDDACRQLLQLTAERTADGGLVLATNVGPAHASTAFLELILDWNLETRDGARLLELAPQLGRASVYRDAADLNVFLEIRR